MKEFRPDRIYQRNPAFVTRKIAGEVILIPLRQKIEDIRSIFNLNETAGGIWELIDGTRTCRNLRDALIEKFELQTAQAESDLSILFKHLEEIEAIQRM